MVLLHCTYCCRNNKEYIFPYCELQDSLDCFISTAPKFPENTPSFICVMFHAECLEEKVDTIVVFMKGNGPVSSINTQKIIGATYFDKHICEIVYDGFECLPNLVNEDILTLRMDDYKKYGYNKGIYDNPQYKEWLYATRHQHQKDSMTRSYRINRPNPLERY